MNPTNGKGSKRRPEDSKKLADNWDKIFKPKPTEQAKPCQQKPD